MMSRFRTAEETLSFIEARSTTRRSFFRAAGAVTAALSASGAAFAKGTKAKKDAEPPQNMAAAVPEGFVPMSAPGRIVKVKKAGSLEANGLYPKQDEAKDMLRKALSELTGKADLTEAVKLFVHKDDKVCVKVNGIAKQNMGTNKELVLPFLEALIASGVRPDNITVLEQYGDFLGGTRITAKNVPQGVKISLHMNKDATMAPRTIPGTGRSTQFVKALTEATALINFSLIKDHSICGYTGCLKNMTHGCTVNPHDFHDHNASPQIALLAAQDVIKSRMRLHIVDGYKVMADGGPLYKKPQYVVPHEAVYVSTDPVALDLVGWEIVEKQREAFGLGSLAKARRSPSYIRASADLGLGMFDKKAISLKEVAL